ncbi:MAG: WD40/YVTN/BNR-like repeat-containing protein [Moheibacter sp.]
MVVKFGHKNLPVRPITSVKYSLPPNIGYIIDNSGTLLKTTDAGESWTSIDTGQTVSFYGISCVNENIIYISAYQDYIFKTEDGGNSWDTFSLDSYFIDRLQFFESGVGYAHIGDGIISKTVNGGENWQELGGWTPSFYFLDELVGFLYQGGVYKTINGGNNFSQLSSGMWSVMNDTFIIDENNIWGLFHLNY